MPFDPFPESPEAAQGIDPIMGMNDSLGCCSKEKLLALKHVQRIRVDSQVLAFLLLFLALFFLCLTKVDSFLVSVPCQMKHPPPRNLCYGGINNNKLTETRTVTFIRHRYFKSAA